MCLTFRRKVSRFWGIRTFTKTALSHTRVSLKPATLFDVEKDLGTKLVPVLLYALRKCTTVSRLFHTFVVHPTSCGRGKWLPKLFLQALLAVNWTKDVKCEFLLEARMSNTSHYSVAE